MTWTPRSQYEVAPGMFIGSEIGDIDREVKILMKHWIDGGDLRLIEIADETGQTPTEWQIGKGTSEALKEAFGAAPSASQPIFGVPSKYVRNLPNGRVVLKAGRNTVGAFTVVTIS